MKLKTACVALASVPILGALLLASTQAVDPNSRTQAYLAPLAAASTGALGLLSAGLVLWILFLLANRAYVARHTQQTGTPSLQHARLTRDCYSFRWGPEEVVLDFWSGPLEPARLIALAASAGAAVALLVPRLAYGLDLGAVWAHSRRDVPGLLLSLFVMGAGSLAALYATRRTEVRLESKGPMRITTSRLLGAPRRREFSRTACPRLHVGETYWSLSIAGPDTSLVLLSGALPAPETVVQHLASLEHELARVAPLAKGHGPSPNRTL